MAQQNHCWDEPWATIVPRLMVLEAVMVRDDDYLRQLLQAMEADGDWQFDGLSNVLSPTPEDAKRDHHLALLADAGLITFIDSASNYCRLTNAGHDFIVQTRKSETWEAVKSASNKAGGFDVGLLAKFAEAYVKQKAQELGIWPGA